MAEDDDNGANSGSAFLFDVSSATQLAIMYPSDSSHGDQFGGYVSISDTNIILVGAVSSVVGMRTDAAYYFDISCPADFTGDGTLDIFDVFAFLDEYNAGCPLG